MEEMTIWTDVLDAIPDIRVDRTNPDGSPIEVLGTTCEIAESAPVDLCDEFLVDGDQTLAVA